MAVDAHRRAHRRDQEQQVVIELHVRERTDGGRQALEQAGLVVTPYTLEACGVVLVRATPLQHLDAHRGVSDAGDIDAEPEPIEQLRPDLPFFGVHGADENEAGRVLVGDALALNDVASAGGSVQQGVHEVVVEQVHFIDVEDPAVGIGKDARLEAPLPLLERNLKIDRPDDTVLGGRDREVDDPGCAPHARQGCGGASLATLEAQRTGVPRVAGEAALLHHVDLGENGGQAANRGRLGRALLAPDEDTADARIDDVDQECGLQCVLSHDCAERERRILQCHESLHNANGPTTLYGSRAVVVI